MPLLGAQYCWQTPTCSASSGLKHPISAVEAQLGLRYAALMVFDFFSEAKEFHAGSYRFVHFCRGDASSKYFGFSQRESL